MRRFAHIGNLWFYLANKSKDPALRRLHVKAWKLIQQTGLERQVHELLDAAQAGEYGSARDEKGNLQREEFREEVKKRGRAKVSLYQLLEQSSILSALESELKQAGFIK